MTDDHHFLTPAVAAYVASAGLQVVSLPAISRHLKVLERAGLIIRSREAQRRPSRLQADPLDEAVEWMQSRKRTWEARMDRLEAHLRQKGEQDE